MNTHILTVFALLMVLAATGVATDASTQMSLEDLDEGTLEDVAEQYNSEYADQLPGLIRSIIANERINVYIETDEGEAVYGVVLDGANVSGIQPEAIDDPTLRVYTSMDTIEEIGAADNPRKRAVAAFKSDEIRYEAVGFFRSVTLGIVSFFITLFG